MKSIDYDERRANDYVNAQVVDGRVNLELVDDAGMVINLGPQHPATHGTLRIVVKLDGERVVWADPVCGYMHRGYEKLTEVRTYPQVNTLINRIDWLGSFCNEVPFILAVEELLEVVAPQRAQWIRTALFELGRIANLVIFLGDMGMQLGAITPPFLAFRDREHVLDLIESATGGRFHPHYNRVGGIKEDLPEGWIADVLATMPRIRNFCDEMDAMLTNNEIFRQRTVGVGVITKELALSHGLSGANARASGIDWDLRRDAPSQLAWKHTQFEVATSESCDSFARYQVRLKEVRESTKIVEQLLNNLPAGSIQAKVRKVIKVPPGATYVETENPLGQMGFYVVSNNGLGPYRVKIRTPSFNNVSVLTSVCGGMNVSDLITTISSLYFILGDVDK